MQSIHLVARRGVAALPDAADRCEGSLSFAAADVPAIGPRMGVGDGNALGHPLAAGHVGPRQP
jgi:hypothetical protein